MSAPFTAAIHRHASVCDILHNLNAFIMNLAPNTWIGDFPEGTEHKNLKCIRFAYRTTADAK